jgi:hypothetical protein
MYTSSNYDMRELCMSLTWNFMTVTFSIGHLYLGGYSHSVQQRQIPFFYIN